MKSNFVVLKLKVFAYNDLKYTLYLTIIDCRALICILYVMTSFIYFCLFTEKQQYAKAR